MTVRSDSAVKNLVCKHTIPVVIVRVGVLVWVVVAIGVFLYARRQRT